MKCKRCYDGKIYLAPDLVQSGFSEPFSYKCNICNTLYSSTGKQQSREDLENRIRVRQGNTL